MRPPRLAAFPYRGRYRYFVTCCTWQRRRLFTDRALVTPVLAAFLRTAKQEQFAVIAYCLMPDHLHLLAEGLDSQSDFKRFVARAKQRSGYATRSMIGGRLWQAGYFDRVLREEERAEDVARYILQNPVRAGLVSSPFDYPFLGSATMSVEDLALSVMARRP